MNTNSPSWPYEWMGGAATILHTLLHTADGRAFLDHAACLADAESYLATYVGWVKASLADAERVCSSAPAVTERRVVHIPVTEEAS